MNKAVVFVANGFSRENKRLQPWRYIYEIAVSRTEGNHVYIITEGETDESFEDWEEGLTVIYTRYLSVKNQFKLKQLMVSLKPKELWWSTTPRTLAFYPLLSTICCKKIAFITCPLYTWMELIKATLAKVPYAQTNALWRQRLIPRIVFRWFLNTDIFEKIFVQSMKNMNIIKQMGVSTSKMSLVQVGIDKEDIEPANKSLVEELKEKHAEINNRITYLYFGALRPIRGFDSLIKAFPHVVDKNPQAHLMVLARGSDEVECIRLKKELHEKGLGKNVTVVGGWLSRDEVWAYIEISDAAVLPFVLVPSDIPIAVLEAMARGKPVVVSHVDGLPEMADGRGVIVDPLNTKSFSEQLYLLSVDHDRRKKLGVSAESYMKTYPSWKDVGQIVAKALH